MKLFAKLMLAALVLALLLPFTILKNDQGKPLMSFASFGMPDFKLPGLPDMSSAKKLVPAGGVDTFYKWYDAKGNVQFTTEPPPDGVEYTVKQVDPNTNVIQAVQLPVEEIVGETPEVSDQKSGSVDELASPYSKETVDKLFEDTKNIEKLLNERMKNQNAAIN